MKKNNVFYIIALILIISLSGCKPEAFFYTYSSTYFPGHEITFYNNSENAKSYLWDFGDGTTSDEMQPTHIYNKEGFYTVTLTVFRKDKSDSLSLTLEILKPELPEACFSTLRDTFYTNESVYFTNCSEFSTYYDWSFGDGTFSDYEEPTHTYTQAGTYSVKLIASKNGDLQDDTTKRLVIEARAPIPCFSINGGSNHYTNSDIGFTNCSQYAESYFWYFDNSSTSTETHPSTRYTAAGSYTVSLTSYGSGFSIDTTHIVNIQAIAPNSCFTHGLNLYSNESISFNSCSQYTEYIRWNFGDGSTSSSSSTSHSFSDTGYYNVRLVAYGAGFTDTTIKTLHITLRPPQACFTVETNNYINEPVSFNYCSNYTTSCEWNFGDGETSNVMGDVTHTYDAVGDYTVTLIAYGNGMEDIETKTINIDYRTPIAEFSFDKEAYLVNEGVQFINTSQYASSYEWDFDDYSANSYVFEPNHSYSSVGTYNVTLTATGDGGYTDIVDHDVLVINMPNSSFDTELDIYPIDTVIEFDNLSDDANSYLWDFDDGATSDLFEPTHSYSAAGNYNVTLTASAYEYSDTDDKTITIFQPPTPCINTNYTLYAVDENISFENCTDFGDSYLWRFGDGLTSAQYHTTHQYSSAGTYNVILEVVKNGFTFSSEPYTLTIIDYPVAEFATTYSSYSVGEDIYFSNLSSNENTYAWDFGDGYTSEEENPTHSYTDPGTYTVTLTVSYNGQYPNTFDFDLTIVE